MSAGTQKWVFVIPCLKEQTGLIFEPLLFRFSVFRASILHSKQNTLHCSQAVLKSLQKSASPQRRVIVSKFNEVNIFLSTHKLQCGIEEICTNLASSFRCSQKIDNPVVFYLPPTALMATCQRLYNLLQPRLLFVPFPLSFYPVNIVKVMNVPFDFNFLTSYTMPGTYRQISINIC